MNVTEYAKIVGVSPRRVRALIAAGSIRAHRHGRNWVVDESSLSRTAHSRRPLSESSQRALAMALHTRSLDGPTGQMRARTAARIRLLRESVDPAGILVDWWGGNPPESTNGGFNLVAHAIRGNSERVHEVIHRKPAEYLRDRRDLARAVRDERVIRAWSKTELAIAANVNTAMLSSIEQAKATASVSDVRHVLRALAIEPVAIPAPGSQ